MVTGQITALLFTQPHPIQPEDHNSTSILRSDVRIPPHPVQTGRKEESYWGGRRGGRRRRSGGNRVISLADLMRR
ncbi:unnamed protein product [Nezara viridula]|uniref:Uncharacterized protein n=1 Tax=Nezara viridula TaxID=85310 RepID=A0A9P0HHH7_NEZVI|nr:unnamed protein product [Nezara viridula]